MSWVNFLGEEWNAIRNQSYPDLSATGRVFNSYSVAGNYNGSVLIAVNNLYKFVEVAESLFDGLLGISEQVGSIKVFPIFIFNENSYTDFLLINEVPYKNTKVLPSYGKHQYLWLGEHAVISKYNDFRDYPPYCKIQLFLPFVGFVDIDKNEVAGKYLQFRLFIDYDTGVATYIIGVSDSNMPQSGPSPFIKKEDDFELRILKTIDFNLGIDIPLGQSSSSDIKRNVLLGVMNMAFSAVSASAAPVATPSVTTSTTVGQKVGRSKVKGSKMKVLEQTSRTTTRTTTPSEKPYDVVSEAFSNISDVVSASYHGGSGNTTGSINMLTCGSIKVFYTYNKFATMGYNNAVYGSAEYNHLFGRPYGKYAKLSNLRGYTEISKVHMEINNSNIPSGQLKLSTATNDELDMLEKTLYNSIIL